MSFPPIPILLSWQDDIALWNEELVRTVSLGPPLQLPVTVKSIYFAPF
jgi:hypothetical protein